METINKMGQADVKMQGNNLFEIDSGIIKYCNRRCEEVYLKDQANKEAS